MNCFKNDIIQKYIDGEASPKEVAFIERHMADCERCATKMEHQRQLSASIKNAMNLLVKDGKPIPTFNESHWQEAPAGPEKMRYKILKRVVYGVSAACILILILVLVPKKEPLKECPSGNQITVIYSLDQQVDANRPIMDQEIVITIVGPDGKVMDYPE